MNRGFDIVGKILALFVLFIAVPFAIGYPTAYVVSDASGGGSVVKPQAISNANPLAQHIVYFDECDNDIGYSYGTPWPYTDDPHTCLSGKQDCCGWYIMNHVHDLGEVINGTYDLYILYRPGFNEGCTDTVKVYVSEDNQTWTKIAQEPVKAHDMDGDGKYPQVWQQGVLNIENYTGRFRWVKVSIPNCFNDYSSVSVTDAANTPPVAGFTQTATIGRAPFTVTFNASDSYDPDGDLVTYSWRFGDKWSATATGQVVTYTYEEPGTYTVELIVKDQNGGLGIAHRTIRVYSQSANISPEITSFSYQILNDKQVEFNFSAEDPDGQDMDYALNFGDGSIEASGTMHSGETKTVTYTYSDYGTYNATLVVTNPQGLGDSESLTVVVQKQVPDIAITNVVTGTLEETREARINVTVTNQGTADVENVEVSFNYGNSQFVNLSAGETKTLTFVWTPQNYGPNTLYFEADPNNSIDELDETNNDMVVQVYVNPLPDFTVGDVSVDGINAAGHTQTINAEILNIGHKDETTHYIIIVTNANNNSDTTMIQGDVYVTAGGSETVSVSWTPAANGTYAISVSLDNAHQVDELNESNNIKTVYVTIGNNHPPEIEPIDDQIAYVNEEFRLVVNATDQDGDTLQFSDNSTLFDIDQLTGEIVFTPNDTDIGNYTIEITVTDGIDSTSTTFDLEIVPPVLEIENVSVSATNDSATIIWDTTQPAISRVLYGLTTAYGNVIENQTYTTSHEVVLTNLLPDNTYYYRIEVDDNYNQTAVYESSFQTSPNPAGVPDLAISAVYYPSQIFEDEQANVTVEITNLGDASTGQFWVTLEDGNTQYVSVADLAPGNSINVSFVWTPAGTGTFGFIATVDPMDAVNETNETNNQETFTITVLERVMDVALTDIAMPDSIIEGDSFSVIVNASNLGTEDLTTNLTLYVNGTEIETRQLSLTAGENSTETFNLILSDVGDYEITAKVDPDNTLNESNEDNNEVSKIITVVPNQPPVANAGDDVSVAVGETITFNASGSYDPDGNITNYEWDFGDGTNATGMIVNHTYANAGVYTVTLTVTDNKGDTGTDTLTAVIWVPEEKPDFAIYDLAYTERVNPGEDAWINFTVYNLGNATDTVDISIYANDEKVFETQAFLDVGDATYVDFYLENLTSDTNITIVLDENNTVDEYNETNNQETFTITVNKPPVAMMSADTLNGPTPLTVTFSALQSYDPDGNITNYEWDFGDGSTATSITVNHTYTNAGIYTVTLTVTDNEGLTDYTEMEIVAWSPVENDVGVQITNYTERVNPGDIVEVRYYIYNLGNDTTVNVSAYADGIEVYSEALTLTGGEQRYVEFNFSALASDFTLSVVADPDNTLNESDESNNEDSVNVSVNDYPIASFTADKTSGYAPLTIAFNASGSYDPDGSITTYEWDFGDGSNATGVTVNHTFSAGTYTVRLTVTDNEGLTAVHEMQITARTRPSTGGGGGGSSGWVNPNPPTPKPIERAVHEEGVATYTLTFEDSRIDLARNYDYDPDTNETTVTLVIHGVGPTRTYRIVDEIPKSVAQTLEDVNIFPAPDEVIREDPVIAWRVTLRDGDTFTVTYTFEGKIPINDIKSMSAPAIQVVQFTKPPAEEVKPGNSMPETTGNETNVTNVNATTTPITGFLVAAREGSLAYLVILVLAGLVSVSAIALEKFGYRIEIAKEVEGE